MNMKVILPKATKIVQLLVSALKTFNVFFNSKMNLRIPLYCPKNVVIVKI